MLQAAAGRPMHLRTSLVQLDAALCGGIPTGSVTEVRGGTAGCMAISTAKAHCRLDANPSLASVFASLPALNPPAAQVVGPAGLGKTQLCLQLAVLGCLEREAEGGSVAFIDTEKKFSARRWVELCTDSAGRSSRAGGTAGRCEQQRGAACL
jgi:RAD51-like protein 1